MTKLRTMMSVNNTVRKHKYFAIMNATRKTPVMYCASLFVRRELAMKYASAFTKAAKKRVKLSVCEVGV